jgi:hypothetical protein
MRTSQIAVVCLSLLVGYVAATALNRPSSAQPPAPQPVDQEGSVWRYQLVSVGNGGFPTVVLTDTATGRVWVRQSAPAIGDQWHALGSPASLPVGRNER